MNLNDLPKPEPGKMPEGFFENQAYAIFQKTLEIEKWNLPGTKNVDQYFSVPAGYWLEMEDEIRNKCKKPERIESAFRWKPALAMAFSVLFFVGLSWIWILLNPQKTENWNAQLDKINSSELLAYVETRSAEEVREFTENLASQVLKESDLIGPDIQISDQVLEENLEEMDEQDILQNIDSL
jgi:hypothetical protein